MLSLSLFSCCGGCSRNLQESSAGWGGTQALMHLDAETQRLSWEPGEHSLTLSNRQLPPHVPRGKLDVSPWRCCWTPSRARRGTEELEVEIVQLVEALPGRLEIQSSIKMRNIWVGNSGVSGKVGAEGEESPVVTKCLWLPRAVEKSCTYSLHSPFP